MTSMEPTNETSGGGGWGPLVLFVGLVVGARVIPGTPASELIFCPLRRLIDFVCPGCGMTRSVTSFVRGDVVAAFDYHVFGPLLVTGLGIVAGLRVADHFGGRPVFEGLRRRWDRHSTAIWLSVLIVVLVYWIIRLL